MSYLEDKLGQAQGQYTEEFLDVDRKSGPWLEQRQATSPVAQKQYARWDLDHEQSLIYFGDDQRVGLVARFEVLGTYSAEDATWLWGWANPKLERQATAVAEVRDAHADTPELSEPTCKGDEAKAWTLAAAAGFLIEAQTCYRIPGDVQTFVGLFDIKELDSDDQRFARDEPKPDEERAFEALAAYAGPMALNTGGMLLDALRSEDVPLDEALKMTHQFADSLNDLAQSPVGKDTKAAADALNIANVLRQGALVLSVPRDSEDFMEGAAQFLSLLKELAQQFGAWSAEDNG